MKNRKNTSKQMRKKMRRIAVLSFGALICAALLLLGVYRESQQVPPFYSQALIVDAEVLEAASDEMGSRATALASDAGQRGDWNALFTSDQINGWLAVDLGRLHPGALPEGVHNPRVVIQPGRITLGFGVERGGPSIVYSVEADMYVSEPNVVACRLRRARAGGLPLPLSQVLDTVAEAARRLELPLRWAQADGDPVALVTITRGGNDSRRATRLRTLELLDGEVYVAGTTGPDDDAQKPCDETAEQPDLPLQPAE